MTDSVTNKLFNASVESSGAKIKISADKPVMQNQDDMDLTKFTRAFFRIKNSLLREFLAELLATFVLIVFGCGSVAQVVLSRQEDNLSIHLSWGLAVLMGCVIGGNVSGAHMNPAVSFAMIILGKIQPLKFFLYLVAQAIGAFCGSLVVYLNYLDALNAFDGGQRQISGLNGTAGIWATYPKAYLSTTGAFFDQVFGTGFLILIVLAVGDKKNGPIKAPASSAIVALTVTLIGMTFGHNCGYAINPIRDFIPRVFTSICGWGTGVFTEGNTFFWVPVVAPFVGALLSTFVYAMFICNHWPNDNPEKKGDNDDRYNDERQIQIQYTKRS